jgi:hypothetical protein
VDVIGQFICGGGWRALVLSVAYDFFNFEDKIHKVVDFKTVEMKHLVSKCSVEF